MKGFIGRPGALEGALKLLSERNRKPPRKITRVLSLKQRNAFYARGVAYAMRELRTKSAPFSRIEAQSLLALAFAAGAAYEFRRRSK